MKNNIVVIEKYIGLGFEVWEYRDCYFIAQEFADGVCQLFDAVFAAHWRANTINPINGHNTQNREQAMEWIKENYK